MNLCTPPRLRAMLTHISREAVGRGSPPVANTRARGTDRARECTTMYGSTLSLGMYEGRMCEHIVLDGTMRS